MSTAWPSTVAAAPLPSGPGNRAKKNWARNPAAAHSFSQRVLALALGGYQLQQPWTVLAGARSYGRLAADDGAGLSGRLAVVYLGFSRLRRCG
jgi:hypothetical protein